MRILRLAAVVATTARQRRRLWARLIAAVFVAWGSLALTVTAQAASVEIEGAQKGWHAEIDEDLLSQIH